MFQSPLVAATELHARAHALQQEATAMGSPRSLQLEKSLHCAAMKTQHSQK